jgi:leucyl-tRNA synthetase
MSKSLENIVPLRQAIAKYGADSVRMGVMATAELGQDTDFSESVTTSIQERLYSLMAQARKLGKRPFRPARYSNLDRWMLGQLNKAVSEASASMDKLRVREVINKALYQLDNDLSWYQRRLGPVKGKKDARGAVLRKVLETRALLLSPMAPHTAEEIWSILGNKGLAAEAKWPVSEREAASSEAEQAESLIQGTLEDTGEILKTTGLKAQRIVYYTAPSWKWRIFLMAQEARSGKAGELNGFTKRVMSEPDLRELGKAAADYAGKVAQQVRQSSEEQSAKRKNTGQIKENQILQDALGFLSRELRSKVEVWSENAKDVYDPKGRARMAEPYRPAILVE